MWTVRRLKSTLTTPKTTARRKRGRQRAPAAPVLQAAQTPTTARSVAASGQGLRPTRGGRLAATAQMIHARGSSGRARRVLKRLPPPAARRREQPPHRL